jgi:hypothetical protein
MRAITRVGIISDTHNLLRPEALRFLQGSQMIIHCGDICRPGIVEELARIAPVTAVRGNNDEGVWAEELPECKLLRIGAISAYVIHDISKIDIDPEEAGVTVVLSGHSHRPCVEHRGGIMYLNPGSAGPRRFKLPVSAAELIIESDSVVPRIAVLDGGGFA